MVRRGGISRSARTAGSRSTRSGARDCLDEEWSARLAVGSRVDGFYPFADIGVDRTIIPSLFAEGVLAIRSLPGRGLSTSALLGARYLPDVGSRT